MRKRLEIQSDYSFAAISHKGPWNATPIVESCHRSITELELRRDNNLVAILRALKKTNSGAGKLINPMDARLERETNRH